MICSDSNDSSDVLLAIVGSAVVLGGVRALFEGGGLELWLFCWELEVVERKQQSKKINEGRKGGGGHRPARV